MRYFIYAWKDKKVNAFMKPFYDQSEPGNVHDSVVRTVKTGDLEKLQGFNQPIALYFLGCFDDETGEIALNNERRLIIDSDEFIPVLNLRIETAKLKSQKESQDA